ncbi:hypothetical protein BDZ88DRAFT_505147 [Geranomyces variabilis]|nr:hypothetical protein BDZ88DRAFT_505147 [Geranomyces variabilis]KAJ3133248.1 hypothetical protein HDU90_006405 [Geranomyces variabilis]
MTSAPILLVSPPNDSPPLPTTTTTATMYHPAMLPAPSYTRTDNNSNNSPAAAVGAAAMKPTTVFHYTHSPHRHALAHPLVASILADPAAVWACDASWVEGVRGVLGEGWNRWVGRQTEGGLEGREGVVVVEQSGADFQTYDAKEEESDEEQEEEEDEEDEREEVQPPADVNDNKPKAVAAADSAATLSPTTQMALAADEQEVAATQPNDPRLLRRRSSLHVLLDRAANLADIKGRVRRAFVPTNRRRGSRGAEHRDTAAANTTARDFLGMTATATAGAFYFPGF